MAGVVFFDAVFFVPPDPNKFGIIGKVLQR